MHTAHYAIFILAENSVGMLWTYVGLMLEAYTCHMEEKQGDQSRSKRKRSEQHYERGSSRWHRENTV